MLSDAELAVILELRLFDTLPVDERAVRAAHVPDDDPRAEDFQDGVLTGAFWVIDHDIRIGSPDRRPDSVDLENLATGLALQHCHRVLLVIG